MRNVIVRKLKDLGIMNSVAAIYFGLGVMVTEVLFVLGLFEVFYDFEYVLLTYLAVYHVIGFVVLAGAFVVDRFVGWLAKSEYAYRWTVEK